jgi:hypothetical protein
MSNEPFGRQGKPVVISITEGEPVDRYDMFTKIQRWMLHDSGDLDFEYTKDAIKLHYFPRAVND